MNTYEVSVTDQCEVSAQIKIVAATEEEAIAKGRAHLKAIQLAAPELYEACEAQVKAVAHFAQCQRGCGYSGNSPIYCGDYALLKHNAQVMTEAAVKKVRAAT